jgi:site-specific recombinase XerD
VRDSLLVTLALSTGMRRSELANLEKKDIHSDFLFVRRGKGGKDRAIPLIPSIAQRLHNFVASKKPNEKVFSLKAPCISNKIRQFANKAGLKEFHTHTMRHKFATDLLERGANIKQVQQLLGHENLATTEVYLSITDKGLRNAVGLLDKSAANNRIPNKLPPLPKLIGEKPIDKPVVTITEPKAKIYIDEEGRVFELE